jgi:hypothetical protein
LCDCVIYQPSEFESTLRIYPRYFLPLFLAYRTNFPKWLEKKMSMITCSKVINLLSRHVERILTSRVRCSHISCSDWRLRRRKVEPVVALHKERIQPGLEVDNWRRICDKKHPGGYQDDKRYGDRRLINMGVMSHYFPMRCSSNLGHSWSRTIQSHY